MNPVVVEPRGEVAVIRMTGVRANSMSAALLDGLIAALDEVEAGDAQAVVITGTGKAFSAGLALPELIDLERSAMRAFIDRFAAAMARVLTCARPVVAAVNGHAIAGGCVLATQCDVRVMADGDGRIGLNEVQLGIGLPAAVIEPLRARLPATSLGVVALEGRLFTPADALRLGLVDALAPADLVLDHAIDRAAELAVAPRPAYAQVKAALLRPVVDAIARTAEDERERWLDTWFSLPARLLLREAVARLAARPRPQN
jgi:enoyl-CoA hydratase